MMMFNQVGSIRKPLLTLLLNNYLGLDIEEFEKRVKGKKMESSI